MPINALDFRVLGTDKDFFWSESQEAFVDGTRRSWRSPEERLAESSRVVEEKLAELRQARIDSSC